MSSESNDCLYIEVEETEIRDVTSIPGIIVGGVIGLIVGGLIGLIFYKLYCYRKGGLYTNHRAVASEVSKDDPPKLPIFSYENFDVRTISSVERSETRQESSKPEWSSENESMQKLVDFSAFLADSTWEGMTLQIGKRHLYDLITLELSQWEERHCCLIQQFCCILNDLLTHKVITEPQHHDILNCEKNILSSSYFKLKEELEVYRKKCVEFEGNSIQNFFGAFQEIYAGAIKSIISRYHARVYHFSGFISKLSSKDDMGKHYHNILLHHVDAVEGFYRKNQDHGIKSLSLLYRRIGLVTRYLSIFLIAECQINKILSSYCNSSLQKMLKTGRISSKTLEGLKESLVFDFTIEKDDLHDALSRINPSLVATYVSDFIKHEQQYNDELHVISNAYENQVSSDGFVESYLTACCEKNMQLTSISKDFADNAYTDILMNISKLSQAQKKRRAEAIHEFCKHLEENDALSSSEVEHLRQDFTSKLDATQVKFVSVCQKNADEIWRQYDDQMINHLREESQVDSSILQDSVTDDLLLVENILHHQINLTDVDRQAIMHERESLLLVVVNEINSFRTHWLHTVENDMAASLARCLRKMSQDMVSDTVAEIIGILDHLWNERSPMKNFPQEMVSVSCIHLIMGISQERMCKIIARRLIMNFMNKEVITESERILIKEIERNLVTEITTKVMSTNFSAHSQEHNDKLSQRIREQIDRYTVNLSVIEEQIRAAQTKRLGRLNVKAQRISQHRPQLGSSPGDLQPYLEQIVLQEQIDRALQSVDFESMQQTLLERLRLDELVSREILEISSDSAARLLASYCSFAGLTKGEFTSCISHAKRKCSVSGPLQKIIVQKFQDHWKNASFMKKFL